MDAELPLESVLVKGELVGWQDGPEGQDLLPLLLVHAGWPTVIKAYANVVMVFQKLKCQRQVNFWARLSNRKVRSLFARPPPVSPRRVIAARPGIEPRCVIFLGSTYRIGNRACEHGCAYG